MRHLAFALLIVPLFTFAACGSGSNAASTGTTGGGSGVLCSPCTGSNDCVSGGDCVFENAGSSQGFCAVPCTVSSTCADPIASCLDLSNGRGQLFCYPTVETCSGFEGGNGSTSGGTLSGTASTTTSSSSSGGSTGSCGTDTYASFGAMFMTTYCTACHTPSLPGYQPPDCTTQAAIQAEPSRMQGSIDSQLMPLVFPDGGGPSSVSASDLTRVDAWLACGAP